MLLLDFSEVDNSASQICGLYRPMKRQQHNPPQYYVDPGIILLTLKLWPAEKSDVTLNNLRKLLGFYCFELSKYEINIKNKIISLTLKPKYFLKMAD